MITVTLNGIDITSQVEQGSIVVSKKIGNQANSASFSTKKAGARVLIPEYDDEVEIFDGAIKIFGGTILSPQTQPMSGSDGIYYDLKCVDWSYSLNKLLASRTYENQTIAYIIADLVSSFCIGFTTNGVNSDFLIPKVVFNQVSVSSCIQRMADIVNYEWDIDENKDVKFFDKYSEVAPFDLTDDNGNYVYKTLQRTIDGSQVANRIKVRGGEYDGTPYTDVITVSGSESKSFSLPYKFANLSVQVDIGAGYVVKNVGIDFVDSFTTDDVLYNYGTQMIRFENNLADGNKIKFTGNPKIPVFVVSEDSISIENRRQKYRDIHGTEPDTNYGKIEKLIKDTSITSNDVARRRANAELYAYAEPVIDAKFKTYTPGLKCGMTINLQSDKQSIDDQLMIKDISFRMRDHESFEYNVGLISTKRFDFLALLQKLLLPDPKPADESESSEEVFTDTNILTIEEETVVVSTQEDFQQVEADDEYFIDALGANTNAIYVLGPYQPTGIDDTKRPGRIGISFALS